VVAPTLGVVPHVDEAALLETTRKIIADPVDVVVVTTGIGFRGWLDTAEAAGLGDELGTALDGIRLVARGPKARGAIRAAGLVEHWSARSETTAEVVEWLRDQGVNGRKIVVQLHGLSDPSLQDALRSAGASVRGLEVYRWGPAPDPAVVERMIGQVCTGIVDAVVHTSAPGAQAMLDAAALTGQYDALVSSLRAGRVLNACVGPVTAAPLVAAGLPVIVPERGRLGALVREIVEQVPRLRGRSLAVAGHQLDVRGQGTVLDGEYVALSTTASALLRALADRPGQVLARDRLLALLPGEGTDGHAVDVAVGRLRTALGDPAIVQTVVKRGYRLSVGDRSR